MVMFTRLLMMFVFRKTPFVMVLVVSTMMFLKMASASAPSSTASASSCAKARDISTSNITTASATSTATTRSSSVRGWRPSASKASPPRTPSGSIVKVRHGQTSGLQRISLLIQWVYCNIKRDSRPAGTSPTPLQCGGISCESRPPEISKRYQDEFDEEIQTWGRNIENNEI